MFFAPGAHYCSNMDKLMASMNFDVVKPCLRYIASSLRQTHLIVAVRFLYRRQRMDDWSAIIPYRRPLVFFKPASMDARLRFLELKFFPAATSAPTTRN
jgi:hypothetical protein